MAVVPLNTSEREQFELHINDIRAIAVSMGERPSGFSACLMANRGIEL